MYYLNGYVYGGEPKTPIKAENVKALPDMMLLITFSNGETRLFDATVLSGKAFEPLKDEKVFMNPKIEYGVVTWMDGEIDCDPEYMYRNSYEYSAVS